MIKFDLTNMASIIAAFAARYCLQMQLPQFVAAAGFLTAYLAPMPASWIFIACQRKFDVNFKHN